MWKSTRILKCLIYMQILILFLIDENLFMIVWHRWTWLMKLNTKKNDDGQTYKKKSAKRIFFYTSLYSLSRIFGILRIFFQKMVFFAAAFVPLWGRGSKIFGSRRDLFCQKSWFWDSIFIVFVGYWENVKFSKIQKSSPFFQKSNWLWWFILNRRRIYLFWKLFSRICTWKYYISSFFRLKVLTTCPMNQSKWPATARACQRALEDVVFDIWWRFMQNHNNL